MNRRGTIQSIQSMHEAVQQEMKGEFKCPICMTCYMSDIFQCINGHSICDTCISIVPNGECPQCRVKYERGKIRNRSLEAVRNQMPFPCRFSGVGCKEQVSFQQMKAHARFCGFGSIVPLCKQIGFHKCDFQVNPFNMWQAIDHFQRRHDGVKVMGPHFDVYYRDVKSCKKGAHFIWNPVIVNLQEDTTYSYNYAFLLICTYDGEDNTMAWKCFHLHHDIKEAPKYYANLKIDSEQHGELTWRIPVLSVLRDELMMKSSFCKTQHSLLKDNFLCSKERKVSDEVIRKEMNGLHVQCTLGSDLVEKHIIKPGEERPVQDTIGWVNREEIKVEVEKKNKPKKFLGFITNY